MPISESDGHEPQRLVHHQPAHRRGPRAERQAHAHLVRAPVHHVRHHAVEADRGQRQRQPGEGREQRHAETLLRQRLRHDAVERLHVVDRPRRIDRLDRGLERCRARCRRAVGSRDQRHVVRPALGVRHEHLGACCRRQIVRLEIADDADDLARRLFVVPDEHLLPDRVFAGEETIGDGAIDDGDARGGGRVASVEVASREYRHPKRLEVARRHHLEARGVALGWMIQARDG